MSTAIRLFFGPFFQTTHTILIAKEILITKKKAKYLEMTSKLIELVIEIY